MHIHILGICGTFMASIAILARSIGHQVSGSDEAVYPPMDGMLRQHGISLIQGYQPELWCTGKVDMVLVGNALSRGNPSLEYVLDEDLPFKSGAQWLAENILSGRQVLAVAGTHGKTTTTAMLVWMLQQQELEPGYLIGGLPGNLPLSAALGQPPFFVIEADEYDTAFNDKRSKFIHYSPDILVCNTLEFDHADIFTGIDDIYRQFHHMIRTMRRQACIITATSNKGMQEVLRMGLWSELCHIGAGSPWQVKSEDPAWRSFTLQTPDHGNINVSWQLLGRHNAENAMAAIAAASRAGLDPRSCCQALSTYRPVSRRLELIYDNDDISVYSDFAHHPTAIGTTIKTLREAFPDRRLVTVIEPASYTMRHGCHGNRTDLALQGSDLIFVYDNGGEDANISGYQFADPDALYDKLLQTLTAGDIMVIMSNSGCGNLLQRLPPALAELSPEKRLA